MVVDGLKFNKCHTVIALPTHDADGNLMPYVQSGKENYVYFGQIVDVPDGQGPAAHLIDTGVKRSNGTTIYAKVIPNAGHSLTNMMYAKGAYNGYVYLCQDGKYFRAKIRKAPVAEVATVVTVATDETPVAEVDENAPVIVIEPPTADVESVSEVPDSQ